MANTFAVGQAPWEKEGSDNPHPDTFPVGTAPWEISDQPQSSIGSKALGYVATGAKALDSVSGAPTRSAIYAAQNGTSPWDAAKKQFGNMTDQAPSGADIAAKAGLSTDNSARDVYLQNPDGSRTLQFRGKSNADLAGIGIDVAANPLNLMGPALGGAGKIAESMAPVADAIGISAKAGGEAGSGAASASAIKAASQRLGFSATPGMLSDSPTVQGLESTLSSSPSMSGALVRRSIKPVQEGLQSAAEDLVSGAPSVTSSAYTAGNNAQNGVMAALGAKADNVKMAYEPFNAELPKMVPHAEDRWKLADQIAKIGDNHIDPNEVSGVIKGTTNRIMNSTSLADIEDTRKLIGNKITKAYSDNDHALVDTLNRIKDKLSNFRDDQFQHLASQAMPDLEGAAMGAQMVDQYKNAMAQHAALMNDLRDVGPLFGIKAKNPRDFIEAFSEIPPEQVAKKLFTTNNYQALQKVQAYFPEEFETIKGMKLQDLRSSSLSNPIDPSNSPVDPIKLITKINKLTPEVQSVLFGEKAQKVKDMQTVLGSMPDKVSAVVKGEQSSHMAGWEQQARDVLGYGVYKALGTTNFSKNAANAIAAAPEALQSIPPATGPASNVLRMGLRPAAQNFSKAAGNETAPVPNQNPNAPLPVPPNNNTPLQGPSKVATGAPPMMPNSTSDQSKGPDKWANDGLQKLKSHVNDDDRALLEKYKGAIMVDPKTKNLLMTASSFSPGSKPLDQIMQHIKTRFGEDKK